MPPKGLSAEEKKRRMLLWMYEKHEVLTLKELEDKCSKATGITLGTIKETLKSLVDDGLVDTDKIGAGKAEEQY
jgi:Fe2+ or Zn2+ uptake regulation protein